MHSVPDDEARNQYALEEDAMFVEWRLATEALGLCDPCLQGIGPQLCLHRPFCLPAYAQVCPQDPFLPSHYLAALVLYW